MRLSLFSYLKDLRDNYVTEKQISFGNQNNGGFHKRMETSRVQAMNSI